MSRALCIFRGLKEVEPYLAAVRSAALEPVPVEVGQPATLNGVSGLLLTGGSDVDPALFGEERGPNTDAPDRDRDRIEMELIFEAIRRDIPVFGICRGLQILNVQQGGTLTQHLGAEERHRRTGPDRSVPAHRVHIAPNTLLASIAKTEEMWEVNSRHHQAIAILGGGLRICAWDPEDGTIEAIERPENRFVLAVQWHPENQAPVRPDQARLFEAFADACREVY